MKSGRPIPAGLVATLNAALTADASLPTWCGESRWFSALEAAGLRGGRL